jgi:hypothetical protein
MMAGCFVWIALMSAPRIGAQESVAREKLPEKSAANVSVRTSGAVRNFCLKTAHPITSP